MQFIEACRKIISIDSTPSIGNMEVIDFLQNYLEEKRLKFEIQNEFDLGIEQANIIARPLEGRPGVEFLLQSHLDTVDPGPFQMWSETGHNPFDATIKENKIYGLGTADVKLDFLCKIEALSSFVGIDHWKLPPVLVGTYGEESGMLGALKLIRRNKLNAKMAIVSEPSDLGLITAGKGFASIEIRIPFSHEEIVYKNDHNLKESTSTQSRLFKGKAAHSSTPHLGESAVAKMMNFLLELPDGMSILEIDAGINYNTVPSHAMLELDLVSHLKKPIKSKLVEIYKTIQSLEKEFLQHNDPEFFPSTPTLNIGLIRTFEDYILISGNCRLPPVITQSIYEGWMRRIHQVCEANESQFRVMDYKKPFRTKANSILVKGCLDELRTLGLSDRCITQSSTNEASLFSRIGIDCVCFGPGKRDGNIHTPAEHVDIDSLNKSILFYKKIIERFCL